ncbi:MAG TPA: FAD-dependent oxidoreductase [Dongiaceae bacterium]|nr:FAD-dependent oxidoreductase [Dongiaceae bacterium]
MIRAARIARYCEERNLATGQGIARLAENAAWRRTAKETRREFLAGLGKAAALGVTATTFGPFRRALAARRPPSVDVAIVGGGIAGLACADTLQAAGVNATIYEGRDRLGGRIWSLGEAFPGPVTFPGQVAERGGEFIDTTHLTIKAYARRFGLALEDVEKAWLPGDDTFFVNGERVPEVVVVDEFRDLVDAIRPDLTKLSSEVTARSFTEFDRTLDFTDLTTYLAEKDAGDIIRAIIDVAYTTEYGCEISQLSTLAFLFFIHIDKRAKFAPFGVFSDERFHVIDGNQQIPQSIAEELAGPIELEALLLAARKLSDGRIELTFEQGGSSFTALHDAVVFALPFSTLRDVELDASLDLPSEKRFAIDNFTMGTNAKLNVGFTGRFWAGLDTNAETWSDLPNHQLSWEVNPSRATDQHAVIVDYSGGIRGAKLNPKRVQRETLLWLTDLDKALPGALAAATRTDDSKFLAQLQHWPSDPLTKGSYTCNQPGYFTTILGNEATPVGNIFFAGEHTDSFYEWQGFMEGAANSGIRAADEVLAVFA